MIRTLPPLVAIVAVIVVMVALAFIARHIRRSGRSGPAIGAAMAAYDEAMHSTAHDTYVEVQAQKDRTLAAPSPGKNNP